MVVDAEEVVVGESVPECEHCRPPLQSLSTGPERRRDDVLLVRFRVRKAMRQKAKNRFEGIELSPEE